jgi:hypothetical protein
MTIKEFECPIFSKNVICDNEISNDISNEFGDWNYTKADIICMGILIGNKIKIFFREKQEDINLFKKQIREELDKYDCLFAFNRNMEYGNFKGFLGEHYEIGDCKAFNGKGWNKQKFFMELVNDKKIDGSIVPKDTLENDSKECIDCYAKGEYDKIINHNVADLIKQALLLEHKDYLINKYKDSLDKNGFIITKNINK